MRVCSVAKSCPTLFVTSWTAAFQAPRSVRFPRQEYWSGLPFLSAGDLPDPGIKPVSPALAGRFFTTEPPGKPLALIKVLMTLYSCRQCAQPWQFCFSLLNNLLSTFLHKPQNCHHCLLQLFPTMGPSCCFQVLAIIQLCLKQCDPNSTFFFLAFKFLFNFILYWRIAS